MSGNQNHISGIYNYCDRWCERCVITSKCSVYANTSNFSAEQNDINNKAFWNNLQANFYDTVILLHEAAEKNGIEINPILEEEHIAPDNNVSNLKVETHPLIKASKRYFQQALQLLENNELLHQDGNALVQLVELGVKDLAEAESELAEITDCLEVVQWYLFQINVKFMRAIPINKNEFKDEFIKSYSDATAKVALIAVDRCILAWQTIMKHLPSATDEIIGLLALLQKIQILGEQTFPEARKFKRVALDD